MRLLPFHTDEDLAIAAANFIAQRIREYNPTADKKFVLGLPTGGTPEKTYNRLVQLYKSGKVSFEHVVTFNMDEYVGLGKGDPESYWTFMHDHLFNHIDCPEDQIHILNGKASDLEKECAQYEATIQKYNGINLFLCGVGQDGHIAFNEPGSSLMSRTRVKTLVMDTKIANSKYFGGDISRVPSMALTIGVGTIMDSQEVLILATGPAKAIAVHMGVEGSVNHLWTVSCLQQHPKCVMMIDSPASEELKVKTLRYFRQLESDNVEALQRPDYLN